MAQDLAREFVADLYARERSGITRSVSRISGDSHAEDLVHDAFVAYLVKSPWATKPGAWIATVARNRALNDLRRPKLVSLSGGATEENPEGFERTLAGTEAAPSEEMEREAVREVVAAALSALPERALIAIRMKFFEGADYASIADALEVRVAQAHVIVHRSLRRLGRELVQRMAAAHGVSGCAPALARLAGLGGGDDSHEGTPCPACRPAWDEICALRIGAWVPVPLVAFRLRFHGMFDRLAGRITLRDPGFTEPISRAATAFVALGVAVSAMTPSVGASPSAPGRSTTQIARPAAGTEVDLPAATTTGTSSTGAQVSKPRGGVPAGAKAPKSVTTVTGSRITPPEEQDDSTHVSNDQVGGIVVCTNIGQGCDRDPDN